MDAKVRDVLEKLKRGEVERFERTCSVFEKYRDKKGYERWRTVERTGPGVRARSGTYSVCCWDTPEAIAGLIKRLTQPPMPLVSRFNRPVNRTYGITLEVLKQAMYDDPEYVMECAANGDTRVRCWLGKDNCLIWGVGRALAPPFDDCLEAVVGAQEHNGWRVSKQIVHAETGARVCADKSKLPNREQLSQAIEILKRQTRC